MTYRYATLLRPPGPGAVPRDGLLQCGYSENLTPSGRRSWGWAEYDHHLSPEDVAHYDLEPLFDEDNNRAGADIPRQKGMNTMQTTNKPVKTVPYLVHLTDSTGRKTRIDVIDMPEGYTAEDYIRDCELGCEQDWIDKIHSGTISIVRMNPAVKSGTIPCDVTDGDPAAL